MHIISERQLREFWAIHPDAEPSLRGWARIVRDAEWKTPAELCLTYPYVSQVGKFTVFNIGGGKYRLIAVVHFNRSKLYVRAVLTHAEYDRGAWRSG